MVGRIGGPASVSVSRIMPAIKGVTLASPLVGQKELVQTISSLVCSRTRVITVDFALGRSRQALSDAGVGDISSLLVGNFDHHDGANPGKTATEVAIHAYETRRSEFTGDYAVIVDHIDLDSVCSTFVALSPKLEFNLTDTDKKLLSAASRYGDYIEEVGDDAMKLALTINAMIFGKNSFHLPFFKLSPLDQQKLFNDVLDAIPLMLNNIEGFSDLYEGELAKLKAARELAISKGTIIPYWTGEEVSLVTDASLPPVVIYQADRHALTIRIVSSQEGRNTYVVGQNPTMADFDLTGLWVNLRIAENKKRREWRLPILLDQDSWGGRNVAGGSAKNQDTGSILTPTDISVEITKYLREQLRANLTELIGKGLVPALILDDFIGIIPRERRAESCKKIIRALLPDAEKTIEQELEVARAYCRKGGYECDEIFTLKDLAMKYYQLHLIALNRPKRVFGGMAVAS